MFFVKICVIPPADGLTIAWGPVTSQNFFFLENFQKINFRKTQKVSGPCDKPIKSYKQKFGRGDHPLLVEIGLNIWWAITGKINFLAIGASRVYSNNLTLCNEKIELMYWWFCRYHITNWKLRAITTWYIAYVFKGRI